MAQPYLDELTKLVQNINPGAYYLACKHFLLAPPCTRTDRYVLPSRRVDTMPLLVKCVTADLRDLNLGLCPTRTDAIGMIEKSAMD